MLQTSSSLAFRSLLKNAAAKSGLARAAPRLTGLTGAATAFHVAALAQEGAIFLVVPTDADVERTVGDARFFFGALRGLSDADVADQVLPLPSQEVDPYRGLTPHLQVASARARAVHALATRTARLVIASARALLPRLSGPDRFAAVGLPLRPGFEISPQALGERLVLAGYVREDPVDQHGEFCVRGGVVDFYPASDAQPVRVEFIGDTVESVRRYDAATQRSLASVDQVPVGPQRELLPEDTAADEPEGFDRTATVIDYVRRAGAGLVVSEIDDVEDRGRALEDQWRTSAEEMQARGREGLSLDRIATPWIKLSSWLASGRRVSELEIDSPREESESASAAARASGGGAPRAGNGSPREESESAPAAGMGMGPHANEEKTAAARASGGGAPPEVHVTCPPSLEYRGRISDWIDEVRKAQERHEITVFVAATPGRAERVLELLGEYELRGRAVGESDDLAQAAVLVTTGQLSRGFHLPAAALQIFSETDLFEEERRTHERRRSAVRSFISDFRDLKAGDFVVHVDNGIGRFVGLKKLSIGSDAQEFMELRYADEDKLFVPLERLDLVQKYTGGANPTLDKLGGTSWEKTKARVKKAMRDMAEELLKLYAARKAVTGHAFSSDTHWQQEFADAFEYELTPDQQAAINDIRRDMETPTPMDRLLCGDVGYGKTEVAMRAAFKAVMDGKQVAFLAPTTVLAFQHLRTLTERFAGFPVRIDMISRFRSKAEQDDVVTSLAAGRVDIIVGTHRLLSKDVTFRDLGLLVVDEEQRFGVGHKEKIKQLRKKVDVLTMTATPIPRTLNMSLMGIRDMSIIETPPRDRLSIQTHVVRFEQDVIARAIRTELERGGQIYFVHNRVESIYSVADLVARLVPEARLAVGHGQTGETELERVMIDFVAHKFDVLVATTIVENGLDIPNANTIIINRADRYGLAQLYQLRGRVGRSDRRAYAYLLIPAEHTLSAVARRRLAAIREFSDLGSGFRIAALDLEIRGAGNLLGGEQSGHIEAVGFDTYMKLLEETIKQVKGEEVEDERQATVNLRLDLRIDEGYIADMNQRLAAYRRVARARSLEEVEGFLEELTDRYGAPPRSVLNLAEYARIRLAADRIGLESLDREGSAVVFKFRQDAKVDPAWLFRLVQNRGDLTLLPPGLLRLDLTRPTAPARAPVAQRRKIGPKGTSDDVSWWTARATTPEVSPGFTRAAMTPVSKIDPAETGGLFERLEVVLEQLGHGLVAG